MPKKPTSVSELKATNKMLVDDMNFLIAGIAKADIYVPLEDVMREAVRSGVHTVDQAADIAGRVSGYLTTAINARRADQPEEPARPIIVPRIILPH